MSKPAFDGASFDKDGNCVKHKTIQLAEQCKQDGRLLWKEIKMNCPKCVAEHHKSRRVTSLGGAGKIKKGRTVHGMSNPLRDTQKSGRHMDKEFDTPFDEKGRCHHHPNIQMATKKVRGGWKILCQACPKCIETSYDEESVHSGTSSRASSRYSHKRGEDEHSVSSRSTKRSITSRTKPVAQGAKYDKNGCCTRHPTVNIAKKKLLGGWKEFRDCPKCLDPNYDDMADNVSVRSTKSATSFRSTGSRRSTRSKKSTGGKSNSSRKGGGKTDRYGALPFDGEGYCHSHPSVRLAKKKALGGWKVLHDICPDCAQDASSQCGSRSSRRSSRGTGRVFDDSGSDASSYKSGKSTSSRKKKIRVKDMRYQDEHGKEGRYSGDVNEDHQPHGQGKMKYKDGSVFAGVWNDGSQAHGKTSKAKGSSSKSSSSGSVREKSSGGRSKKSSKDWARIGDGGKAPSNGDSTNNNKKQAVRKMKWMDYYGDPGEYTGEVDSSNMPDGRGSMKYDHGLIQEGLWTKGQFVEGSDMNSPPEGTGKKSSGASSRQLVPKKPSRSNGGAEGGGELRSSRKPSSRSHGSSRKLDP